MGDGYWHWVLLIGSDADGYLCMDPLYEEKKARPLADHGKMNAICIFAGVVVGTVIIRQIDKKRKK